MWKKNYDFVALKEKENLLLLCAFYFHFLHSLPDGARMDLALIPGAATSYRPYCVGSGSGFRVSRRK